MINEVIEPRSGAACIIDFLGFRAEVAKVEELGGTSLAPSSCELGLSMS